LLMQVLMSWSPATPSSARLIPPKQYIF